MIELKSDNQTEQSSAYSVSYDSTSNNEHDYIPVKYPILCTLNMSGRIHEKG